MFVKSKSFIGCSQTRMNDGEAAITVCKAKGHGYRASDEDLIRHKC